MAEFASKGVAGAGLGTGIVGLALGAEKAELREQIVIGKINEVALSANGRFAALDQTINCISNTVNSVTKVVVPNSSVCPGWGPTCTHAIPCPTTAAPAAPAA